MGWWGGLCFYHCTHCGMRWLLYLAALGSYQSSGCWSPSWGWLTGWLNSSEVPGALARRGHATAHNVPCENGGKKEALETYEVWSWPQGSLWKYIQETVEQTSKADTLVEYSKLVARSGAGSVWEGITHSLTFSSRGKSAVSQARPLCWRKRILSFMYKIARSKNCLKRGPDLSRGLNQLKEGQGWTGACWDAWTRVKLGTWGRETQRPWFNTRHICVA